MRGIETVNWPRWTSHPLAAGRWRSLLPLPPQASRTRGPAGDRAALAAINAGVVSGQLWPAASLAAWWHSTMPDGARRLRALPALSICLVRLSSGIELSTRMVDLLNHRGWLIMGSLNVAFLVIASTPRQWGKLGACSSSAPRPLSRPRLLHPVPARPAFHAGRGSVDVSEVRKPGNRFFPTEHQYYRRTIGVSRGQNRSYRIFKPKPVIRNMSTAETRTLSPEDTRKHHSCFKSDPRVSASQGQYTQFA